MTHPLHIVRISTRIYPDVGGPAKHSYFLSKYSSNRLIKITNISSCPKGEKFGKKHVNQNFDIYYLPFFSPNISNMTFFSSFLFSLKFVLFSIVLLIKINKKHSINLIHAHSPSISCIPAVFFKLFYKIPYFYTHHGLDYQYVLQKLLNLKIADKYACKVITISKPIRNFLFSLPNFEKDKLLLMPNAIECSKSSDFDELKKKRRNLTHLKKLKIQNLDNDSKIIVYVGYMVIEQKVQGMIDFLHAFDEFISEFPKGKNIFLLYIGDGKYYSRLENAWLKIRNKKHVYLVGESNDTSSFFEIAHLSALTSYIEGFPNVLLESMINGVPCIASNVGDVASIIGDTGYIVKPGDISSITKNLFDFFSNDVKQQVLMKKSFQRVYNNFNYSNIGQKMSEIYINIILKKNVNLTFY